MNKFYFKILLFVCLFNMSIKSTDTSGSNLKVHEDGLYTKVFGLFLRYRYIDLTEDGLGKYDFAKAFQMYLESYCKILVSWEKLHKFNINFKLAEQLNSGSNLDTDEYCQELENANELYNKSEKVKTYLMALAKMIKRAKKLNRYLNTISSIKFNPEVHKMSLGRLTKQLSRLEAEKKSVLNLIDLLKKHGLFVDKKVSGAISDDKKENGKAVESNNSNAGPSSANQSQPSGCILS